MDRLAARQRGADDSAGDHGSDRDGLIDLADPEFAPDADDDGFVTSGCGQGGTDCDDRDAHVFPDPEYTSGPQRQCLPVVYPGFSHEWHYARVSLPSWFTDPTTGTRYIYFRGHEDQEEQSVGFVSAAPGGPWSAPAGPILGPAPSSWDARNVSNPSVAYVPGMVRPYVMLYHARAATGGLRQVGLATATSPWGPFERLDPATGSIPITNPVLAPSDDESWLDSGRTLHPSARYDDVEGVLHAWYNARTTDASTLRVFHATSKDGGMTWSRTDDDPEPGPDVVLEPELGWEGSRVTQVSWLDGLDPGDDLEFWYTADESSVGYAIGDETDWVRGLDGPAFERSDVCERMDGSVVSARAVERDPVDDAYYWYYGAASDISGGEDCPGNEDPTYLNGGLTVSYVAEAINYAPIILISTPVGPAASMTFEGDVEDTAPDLVEVTLWDAGELLGEATVEGTGNTSIALQSTPWSLDVEGLEPGTHTIEAQAIDQAGVLRTDSIVVVVP